MKTVHGRKLLRVMEFQRMAYLIDIKRFFGSVKGNLFINWKQNYSFFLENRSHEFSDEYTTANSQKKNEKHVY